MMRQSGLYRTDEIRPVRELFLDARWTLGKMLRKIMRAPAGRPRKNEERADPISFDAEIKRLNLTKPRAIAAQRIGTLPEEEKAKAYADATKQDILPTIELLIDVGRPYWYQASRHSYFAKRRFRPGNRHKPTSAAGSWPRTDGMA